MNDITGIVQKPCFDELYFRPGNAFRMYTRENSSELKIIITGVQPNKLIITFWNDNTGRMKEEIVDISDVIKRRVIFKKLD